MDPPFSDGAEAVSYTTPSRAGPGDRYAETDPFPVSSPVMPEEQDQLPRTDSLCSAGCRSLPQRHASTTQSPSIYALVTPVQPYLLIKSEQQSWPSPPLAPGEFEPMFSHCAQDSSTSAGAFLPNYAGSPASAGSWSPIGPAALLQPGCKIRSQPLSDQQGLMGLCTPTSTDNGAVSSGIASPFPDGVHSFDSSMPGLPLGLQMEAFEGETLSPEELLIGTPLSVVTPKAESPSQCHNDVPQVCREASPPAHTGEPVAAEGKLDEPYAKLIYRAFMSRKNYSMTLQDIYQWFRENTNKAVNEKGGWQNSIRHNLSMNAAFTKNPCREEGGVFSSTMDDSKRANEWILEGWAVRYGVQSTTRYRKGSSRRRGNTRSASQMSRQPTQYSAKRAVSGRKGGCAARDSRLRDRAYGQGLLSPPRSAMPELYYGPEGLSVSHMDTPVQPSGQQGHDGSRPHEGPAGAPFSLVMGGDANMGQDMADFHGPRGLAGVSCGDQLSSAAAANCRMPVQNSFPYGIRDVHFGYQGEQRGADTNSCSARLFEQMPDGLYDWTDSSM